MDGVLHPNDLPGESQINQLTVSLVEAEKPGALDWQNEYLQDVSRYPASKLHLFAESSMIKTTGNCKYLFNNESNATFTSICSIQLSVLITSIFFKLHQMVWNFPIYSTMLSRLTGWMDRSASLERGDVVAMDN